MDRIKKTLDVLHEEYRDRRQRTKSFGSSLEIGSPSDVAHNVAVRNSSLSTTHPETFTPPLKG